MMKTGGAHTSYKIMGLVGLLLWSLAFSANGENASFTEPEKQAVNKRSRDVPTTIGSDLNRVTSVFPSDTVFRTLSSESAASADGLLMGASTSAFHVTSTHRLEPEGESDDAVSLESPSQEEENVSIIQEDVPLNNTQSFTAPNIADNLLESSMSTDISVTSQRTVIPLRNTASDTTVPVLTAISNSSSVIFSQSSHHLGSSLPLNSSWGYGSALLQSVGHLNASLIHSESTAGASLQSAFSQTVVPTTLTILYFPSSVLSTPRFNNTHSLSAVSLTDHSISSLPKTSFTSESLQSLLLLSASSSINHKSGSSEILQLTESSELLQLTTSSELLKMIESSEISQLPASSEIMQLIESSEKLQLTPSSSKVASSSEQISSTATLTDSLHTSGLDYEDYEDYEEDELLLGAWRTSQATPPNLDNSFTPEAVGLNATDVAAETGSNVTKKGQPRRPVPLPTIITNSDASVSSSFSTSDIQPSFTSTSSYSHSPTSAIRTTTSLQIDTTRSKLNNTNSIAASSMFGNGTLILKSSVSDKFINSSVTLSPSFSSKFPATTSLLFYSQIVDEKGDHNTTAINSISPQSHLHSSAPQHLSTLQPILQTTVLSSLNNVTHSLASELPVIRKLANSNNGKFMHSSSHSSAGNGSVPDINGKQQQNSSNTLSKAGGSIKWPVVDEQVDSTSTSILDVTEDIAHFQAEYFPDYNTQYYKDEVYDWPPAAIDDDTAYHVRGDGDGSDYGGELPDYNSEAIAFSAVMSDEQLQSPSSPAPKATQPIANAVLVDPEPTPNAASIELPSLPVIYDPLLVVTSTQSLPEPATSKRDVRSVPESMVSTSPAPPDIKSSAMPIDGDSVPSSDIASSSPIKDKLNRYSSISFPDVQLEPSPSVQEMNQTLSSKTTPVSTSALTTDIPYTNSSRMPFSNRATPHKKQNIEEIITGLKQILGNNVQVASSISVLAPTAESDSTRINNRGPPRFPENDQIHLAPSPDSHPYIVSASPTVAVAESETLSSATRATLEVDAWQPSSSDDEKSDTKTQLSETPDKLVDPEEHPPPFSDEETAGSSSSIKTRPVPFVPDLEASLQEVHYTESSVVSVSSVNLLSSRFGVNFSYTRLPPKPPQDTAQEEQAPIPVQEETLTEVVHEPDFVSTSSSEFVPSGPITEWVPVYLHPQVQLSTSSAGIKSGSSDIPSRDVPYAGIPPRYRPANPVNNLQPYDVVTSDKRPAPPNGNSGGSSQDSLRPYLEQVGASGNVQNGQPTNEPPNVPPIAELPGRRPGLVLPVDPNESTPVLPNQRPDWPQRNPADVIVHDTREPAPEPVLADDIGQVFDVTLTATGVMAQGNSGATGRPYVVPVDIDDVHVGNKPPAGPPIVSADGADDQSVFIDGRRTYFNLNPTDVGGGQGNNGGATRVIGVGMNIDDGNGGADRTPARTPPRVARPPSASVNKPNRIRTTTPLIRIDTCIVGDETACDAEHHEVCRTEAGVSSCMCRPGFAHSASKNTCTAVIALLLYLRLDRLDNQRLAFSSAYEDSASPESQTVEREVVRALDSAFRMTTLGRVYAGVTFNKFYALGGKLAANVTLMLEETTQTRNHRIKQEVSKELVALIQQRSQNVGVSRLYVDAQFSPIPGVQDVNECSDSDLNDCSPNARCDNILGSFKCSCQAGFTDKYENNPLRSGRICSVCSPEYCSNHGDCVLNGGKQECQCKGSYIGSRCEIDGEVLGVALGASLAALLIIILTLVCLCMWSRRWKKDQQKTDMRSSCQAYTTYANKNAQALTHHVSLEDRIRWAHIADAMSNYYTTDPLNRGPTPLALPPTNTPPPPPTTAPPCSKYQQAQLSRSRTSLIDDDDDALDDTNRFHVPRPKSRSSYNQSQNIYYDVDYSARDNFPGTLRGSALNAYPLQNMRPYYS